MYFSLYTKHNHTTPASKGTLADIHQMVTAGTYQTPGDLAGKTEAIRKGDPEAKKTLPIATFSAKFTANRAAKAPHTLSGYVCVDFDKLSPQSLKTLHDKLIKSDYTLLLFVSPSGNGLKWVVDVAGLTSNNFSEVATALLHFTDSTFGEVTDKACTDLSRACYLCHDPNAYLNDCPANYTAADLLTYYAPVKPVTATLPSAPTRSQVTNDARELSKVKTLLNQCQETGTSLTANYEEWLKIGAAFACTFDDSTARDLFHGFSKLDDNYDTYIVDSKFNEIVKTIKPNQNIGIGTFWHLARAKGLLIPKIQKQGNRAMIAQAIQEHYIFYMDKDTHTMYRSPAGNANPTKFQKIDAQSPMINAMLTELESVEINTTKQTLWECIFNHHTYQEISLLQDTLTHIGKQWDGVDHFAALMQTIEVHDKELFIQQFGKWCISLIAQAYGKGRNDYAMILVGAQGTGKTTFFDQLLFTPKYSANTTAFDPANKNDLIMLNTKLLIILDEMATYSKSDLNQLKSTLTKDNFTTDRKFQSEQDYKRNASFCGTSNNAELLRDATGDRRYLVFELTQAIDFAAYNAIDKTQLWAQIITMFNNGFNYKFDRSEIEKIIHRNSANFTMQTQEDCFIDEIIEVTHNPDDLLFASDITSEINAYIKTYGGLTNRINVTTINQKLKMQNLVNKVQYNRLSKKSDRAFVGAKLKQKQF